MKKIIKVLIFLILITISFEVKAYTKEDIISLSSSITTCDKKTSALINGTKATYTRLLNERDVSDKDLTTIYNNISYAKSIIESYNVCSVEQKAAIPNSVKQELYALYKNTNNLIINSSKKSNSEDTKKDNINIVVDSSNNEIKFYENGNISSVISMDDELNYVGLNKTLVITISITIMLLIICIITKILKIKSPLITSIMYILILIIPTLLIFKDQISIVLDTISLMNINEKETISKKIQVNKKNIISYPTYGTSYGKVIINNEEEKLYFGDTKEILKKGIGQSNNSAFPGEGKTTIISGHNTKLFKNLSSLKTNDKITIETDYATFTYSVIGSTIVSAKETEILENSSSLIAYTCYPNTSFYGDKRLVVFFSLIEEKWVGE